MPDTSLHRLLDRNLRLPDEYDDGLSNHLPMALHALHRLGADASRLRRFFEAYAPRLGPASPDDAPPAPVLADWRSHRGRFASLPALRSTFAEALGRDGPVSVLRQAVPPLMTGAGAAAFHGLLRTAHGYEAGHPGELARGLAYWAARWLPLAPPPSAQPPLEFADWSRELLDRSVAWRSASLLISERMQEAALSEPYRALADRLVLGDDTLARLSGWAASLYATTGNFTVLHMVTGCRAARVLLAFDERTAHASLGALVRAVTAACLASGVPAARPLAPAEPAIWPALVSKATGSMDEHCIKLVDACREEEAAYGGSSHALAATRVAS